MRFTEMLNGIAFGTIKEHKPVKARKVTMAGMERNLKAEQAARAAQLELARQSRIMTAEERRDQIPAMVKRGMNAAQIADHFDRRIDTIRAEIRAAFQAGHITEAEEKASRASFVHQKDRAYPKAHKTTLERRQRIIAALAVAPMSSEELAERFSVSRATITQHATVLESEGKIYRTNTRPFKYALAEKRP